MSLYLLDADAVIDILKGISSTAEFVRSLVRAGNRLATAALVVGEVWSGLHPEDRRQGQRFLASLVYLPTSQEPARQAGEWRYDYARRGMQLTLADALIAATAYEHGASLVTANVRHFSMQA
ncbi:MAG TPA: type II toxin-antitoxin system VapC family toxin, partial [Dehalococcoidia bacterium]|nr:type II toxin-antitoxin system VapC family toxin [Dehalococcoidia bacterium]